MNIRLHSNRNLTIHTKDNFNGLPVQTKHSNLIDNYLYNIQVTLQNTVIKHPRTFAVRVDLRLPIQKANIGSTAMSKFFASIKSQIEADLKRRKQQNGRVHPCQLRYIWVKEQNCALNWHCHVLILLNNDCYNCLGKFDAPNGNMAARIKKAWASALSYNAIDIGGLIHFPINPVYFINKNSTAYSSEFASLFYRISYFAKANTKNFGDYSNAFGCSQK